MRQSWKASVGQPTCLDPVAPGVWRAQVGDSYGHGVIAAVVDPAPVDSSGRIVQGAKADVEGDIIERHSVRVALPNG